MIQNGAHYCVSTTRFSPSPLSSCSANHSARDPLPGVAMLILGKAGLHHGMVLRSICRYQGISLKVKSLDRSLDRLQNRYKAVAEAIVYEHTRICGIVVDLDLWAMPKVHLVNAGLAGSHRQATL